MEDELKFKSNPIVGINTDKDGEKFRLAVTRAAKRQREFQRRETKMMYNSEVPKKIPTPRTETYRKNINDQLSYSMPEESPNSPLYDSDNNVLPKIQRQTPFTSIPMNIRTNNENILQKAQEEEDLDDVVTNIINDLYIDSISQSTSARWKSIIFKGFDSILRVLVVVIGIVIGVLGRDAANNQEEESDNLNKNEQIALAVTIMGFSISGLSEIRDQFMFKDRSVVLRKCYKDFEKIGHELLILRASEKDPLDLLVEISEIEQRLNEIDMRAFDGQMVPSTSPQEFKTRIKNRIKKNSSSTSTPPKVVGPENLPLFKSKPVGSVGVPDKNPQTSCGEEENKKIETGDIELTMSNE